MAGIIKNVAVMGLGKVGSLAAELLSETGFTVTGYDLNPLADAPYKTEKLDLADKKAVADALKKNDAVLSCLPYSLNIELATMAAEQKTHYFDLTEDVPTTQHIRKLAATSDIVFAPQCGLAPGFIGIVGAHLAEKFESIRSIRLRVGALPQNPTGLMGYNFNWSPEGVVNEYLNECEVIEHGEHKWVSSLSRIEDIYIGGQKLEAFTTSGGLGTMCETYADRVENLDYKTMRYPGHAQLMQFFFHELLMRDRRKEAGEILTNAKPPVSNDIVYIHAAAEGKIKGHLQREEFVRGYKPQMIAGKEWRAISWTTAASVAAVIEMVNNGSLPQKGFIKQEDIPLEPFLQTKNGQYYLQGDKATGVKLIFDNTEKEGRNCA